MELDENIEHHGVMGQKWGAHRQRDVQYADSNGTMKVKPKFDSKGHILALNIVEDAMSQTESFIEDLLTHHGVKGQKWGVTRKISEIRAHREAARRSGNSEDANRARDAELKAKNSKHGTKALSNKELQDLVTRMNLEQQLSSLKAKQPTKFNDGQKALRTVLTAGKTANEVIAFANSPAGKALQNAIKKELDKSKL